jgi:soluble lytic murein transglycosylase-like protein
VRLVAALLAALVVAAVAVTAFFVVRDDDEETQVSALELPAQISADPLTFVDEETPAYERAAAFGLSHALFAKSPGGAVASARRTAAYRRLIEDAVSGSGVDADLVEAIVFLESAGRPEVIAGDDPVNAAGLTQIVAGTATDFLGMKLDLEASRRLTRQLDAAKRKGDGATVDRLRAERRAVDQRFDPAEALAGTVRYLVEAKRTFGRDDLAVVSYHMGIGNLASVLRAYGGRSEDPIDSIVRDGDLDYAKLYFDSSPLRHRGAWELLASFGDDSQTYYWRVLAAREIMSLYRRDPKRLEQLAVLHDRLPSAELVLHPPDATTRFADTEQVDDALARGRLVPLPTGDPRLTIDPTLERALRSLGVDSGGYRALRPRALRMLRYLASKVHELSGERRPLAVTRTTYDEAVGGVLTPSDPGAAAHAGVHATGFAFDVRRRYGSGAQAAAFQWTLERLQAVGLITWTRGRAAIHVVVSPHAMP